MLAKIIMQASAYKHINMLDRSSITFITDKLSSAPDSTRAADLARCIEQLSSRARLSHYTAVIRRIKAFEPITTQEQAQP